MPPAPRVLPVDRAAPDPAVLAEAVAVLRRGGLVAFPTETVYGLGARVGDAAAIARIFAAKRRPTHHPLIAHVVDTAQARALASRWPDQAARLAAAFWPGPLTLVVERSAAVEAAVSGGGSSIAVRAPAHPVARALIEALGEPIAAPSANVYQGISPTLAAHVVKQLGAAVDLVLDGGPCDAGIESTVVDVRGPEPQVLRPGALDLAALRSVAPDVVAPDAVERTAADGASRASPGMDARHYAPRARLELAPDRGRATSRASALAASGGKVGLVLRGQAADEPRVEGVVLLALPDGPAGYARLLYSALYDLDDAEVDAIVVEDVPRGGSPGAEAWAGVADRLARAGWRS